MPPGHMARRHNFILLYTACLHSVCICCGDHETRFSLPSPFAPRSSRELTIIRHFFVGASNLKPRGHQSSRGVLVEATGFEPTTSASRTLRATNCATPRNFLFPAARDGSTVQTVINCPLSFRETKTLYQTRKRMSTLFAGKRETIFKSIFIRPQGKRETSSPFSPRPGKMLRRAYTHN